MRRRLAWGLIAVALAFVGFALANGTSDGARPAYVTAAVARTDLRTVVTATGTLQPLVRVKVGSQLSGQIAELHVDFNDPVRRDQPMAQLDPVPYEARLREATAALESARANAEIRKVMIDEAAAALAAVKARRTVLEARRRGAAAGQVRAASELERKQQLYQNRTVPASELEAARSASDTASASLREAEAEIAAHQTEVARSEAALRVAQAEFANAQAAVKEHEALLEQAAFELARTTIRAPIDGVVIERNVDRGQTVAASLESPTLFTLAQDLRRMAVHARVDEAGIGGIRAGQAASFEVDAYQGRSFAGKVVQIRQAPEVTQNVVTYPVLIEVDNADRALLPGMTATVRITVAELPAALAVPNAALRFRADRAVGSAPTVWLVRGEGEPVPVQVRTGQADERWTQILDGPIREGDRVVIDDADPREGERSALEIRFGL